MEHIIELKAQAYDAIGQIESWQIKLKELNEEIIKESQKKEE